MNALIRFSYFLLVCCALTSAYAAVLHVSQDGGDDHNSGTALSPHRTIAAALAIARPGDVIELAPGVYRETVTFTRSGAADRQITLRGARGAAGERLSTIDPGLRLDSQKWIRVEAVGPDVYQYTAELPFALSQLVVDGRQIAPLYHRADNVASQDERQYSAREILAWERDHHIDLPPYLEALPFWDTMGAIYYLTENPADKDTTQLYLRFGNGTHPGDVEIYAYPARATVKLDNVSFITLENLNIAASETGVEISGQSATNNHVTGCAIYYGTTRLLVAGGASDTLIDGNTFQMRFYGTAPGAWAGGTDASAAAKNFIYTYYKYWASKHSISDDRSLALHGCRDITIRNNTMDGGLVGMSLIDAKQIQISGNFVKNHSSVGVAVRDQNEEIYIDGNEFSNNSIQFRMHNLNNGWHRGIYVVRNLSLLPEGLGTHLFSHVRADREPVGTIYSPEIYILHNSFIGGHRGIWLPSAQHVDKGVGEFFIINNLFAVDGPVIGGVHGYTRRGLGVGAFDYNLILEPANMTTATAPWFGNHILIRNAEPLTPKHLPPSGWQRQAGAHLGKLPYLTHRRADAFSFISDNYYLAELPDAGAVQLPPSSEQINKTHD